MNKRMLTRRVIWEAVQEMTKHVISDQRIDSAGYSVSSCSGERAITKLFSISTGIAVPVEVRKLRRIIIGHFPRDKARKVDQGDSGREILI